jgi:two-component system response regulator PrrA
MEHQEIKTTGMVSTGMATPTVLIVENEPLLSWSLKFVFAKSGFRTLVAENETKALELFRMTRMNVVLADANLPEVESLQILKDLRAIVADIPVVILGTDDKVWNKDSGGISDVIYCEKPVEMDELIDLIKKLLREKCEEI